MANKYDLTRREALAALAVGSAATLTSAEAAVDGATFALSTFSADVTPPLGHPLLAGWREPAKTIRDRLEARGLVLLGGEKPIVWASIDWCELRNDAYDRWRDALAEAAGTTRSRVLLTCIHQHDTPYADLTAQRLLDEQGLKRSMFDPLFHQACVDRTADALRQSLASRRRVSHYGVGQAEVAKIASNRRVELPGRPVTFNRYSFTRDLTVRNAPDGVIDPLLKTLSFWDGEQAVAAVSSYATHPMSYYGRGEVSYDFVGMARQRRQRDEPSVFQIYVSGCSGDITAARYNEGNDDARTLLAERLHQGMIDAWQASQRRPLEKVQFHVEPLQLYPETGGKLSAESLRRTLADDSASQRARSQAALGLSWQQRCAAGQAIDLPVVDFGAAQYIVLPAESFVAYQLAAQMLRPDSTVLTAGYGECAPGYIPTAQTRREGFVRQHGYCWVALGAQQVILTALQRALKQR